jgi:hypothetical protein
MEQAKCMGKNIPFPVKEVADGLYLAAIRGDEYFRMTKLAKPD